VKSWNVVFTERNRIDFIEQEIGEMGPGQILCRADISLISIGTELRCLKGEIDPGTNWFDWVKYPFHPGYSMTGTVEAVGTDVTEFRVGDRIVTQHPHAQYLFDTPGNPNLMKVPEGVSQTEASWQALGCITQLGARRPDIRLGDNVGIIGLGMLGQLVTQYMRLMGARKIVAMDISEVRLNVARANGATHLINGDVKDAYVNVKDITSGRMLDVVYDITGLPNVLSAATKLVRKLGKVVLLGDNTMPSKQTLGPNVVSDSVSILGIHGSMCPDTANEFNPWTWQAMADLFFELLQTKRMDVSSMTQDAFSPADAGKVYKWLADDRPETTGVVFDWSELE
jgi:threonine dehydrogenase-like Zn-dependent dehydrogenase